MSELFDLLISDVSYHLPWLLKYFNKFKLLHCDCLFRIYVRGRQTKKWNAIRLVRHAEENNNNCGFSAERSCYSTEMAIVYHVGSTR